MDREYIDESFKFFTVLLNKTRQHKLNWIKPAETSLFYISKDNNTTIYMHWSNHDLNHRVTVCLNGTVVDYYLTKGSLRLLDKINDFVDQRYHNMDVPLEKIQWIYNL